MADYQNPLAHHNGTGHRCTYLASALALYQRAGKTEVAPSTFVRKFVAENLPKMKMWGESAVPYFVMAALQMESTGQQMLAESHLLGALSAIKPHLVWLVSAG